MHPAVTRARALLTARDASMEDIARAVDELFDVPIDFATRADEDAALALVETLIWASHKAAREVRLAAVHAMSSHPVPRLERRLLAMAEGESEADRDVRAAAFQAGNDLWDAMVACMYCGVATAKIAPGKTGDPEDTAFLFPVFCSDGCAIEFALDRAREQIRESAVHLCRLRGAWAPESAAECHDCEKLRGLGGNVEDPPEATAPTRKSRRTKSSGA